VVVTLQRRVLMVKYVVRLDTEERAPLLGDDPDLLTRFLDW
jgi:hypothetical protein